MDDTPVYINMVSPTTLDFIGNKNLDGATTGNEKSRFTVVITVSASGKMLKAYVIFKGLKNVPKCPVLGNIVVNVSMGSSMKEELMLDYCKRILSARGPFLCNEDSMLLLDTHGSHMHESVKKQMESMKVKPKYVPAKTTSYLQPVDVSINGPFKSAMRDEWNNGYENSPKSYTPKGYRKRPSYEWLFKMMSNALKK